MKKFLAALLALMMLLAVVSCDDNTPGAESNVDETGGNPSTETKDSGSIETALWKLAYDDSVWQYSEDSFINEDDDSEITLQILDPENDEYYLISVTISASIEEPYSFRDDLVDYGFDQYEYAVNNSYELVSVAGLNFLKYEGESWGEKHLKYFNRFESAGATVSIDIRAEDTADSRVVALLNGLSITLPETGNEDGPWEWEGTPFSTTDHSGIAGTYQLSTKWLSFDNYIATNETFNHDIAIVGNIAYLLTDGMLKEYSYDGSSLTFVKDIALEEDDYEYIQATADGTLWLCGSLNDILCIKDGVQVARYEDIDNLAMHPSGEWGINYFTSAECEKVTFANGGFTTEPITFSEVSTIMHLMVDGDTIYVCGSAADDSGHKVYMYDFDGNLIKTLTDKDGEGLGSITYIVRTDFGYLALDGNMRDVIIWSEDGSFIGSLEDSDLFGTYYPWFCSADVTSEGTILVIMTEEREDRSATELIAFNLF